MSDSLTVCQVVPTLSPDHGGPAAVAIQLAAAQATMGHEVHMFCHERPQDREKTDAFLATIPHIDLVQFHRVPLTNLPEALFARQLRRELAPLAEVADVIHLHCLWDPSAVAVAKEARRHRCPYVIAPHGVLDPYCMRQKRLKKRIMLKLVHRRMLNRAAAIHLLNADERKLVAEHGLRAPAFVFPNGVHLDEIDPLPEQGLFRAKHPELGDRPYFLYLARLHSIKGLDLLVDAFAEFLRNGGECDLVIAGPDAGVRSAIEQQIARLDVGHRIHLVGPQYGVDKYAALRDAFAFVLTSRHECFSISIAEGMAFSLPVLISDQCHFPEIAEVNAGIIVPLDRTKITQGLHDLAQPDSQATSMGKAGRTLIETEYTWSAICERLIEIYRRLSETTLQR